MRWRAPLFCLVFNYDYSSSSFTRIIWQGRKPSAINWFLPYIVLWYHFSRLRIIVFLLPAFRVPSLSCCHWRLIPTFCNLRCSTFGQRCGGQLRGLELTFTSSIYFYCSSIYCSCNGPLIVISPPCRVFWYLKFFLNSFVLLNNSKVHFRLTFLDFPSPLLSLVSRNSRGFKLFTALSARKASAVGSVSPPEELPNQWGLREFPAGWPKATRKVVLLHSKLAILLMGGGERRSRWRGNTINTGTKTPLFTISSQIQGRN